jgi:hypothetical protein
MTNILQFKITLLGSQPLIWRRFQVTDDYRFDRFHQVIYLVMGWMNSHLHEFHIGERKIGMRFDDPWSRTELIDETKVFLHEMNFQEGDKLHYLYDFGDYWEHLLEVQHITKGSLSAPSCLNGQNACPPEDCGGTSGYANLLKVLNDPKDSDYDNLLQWLPDGFSPNFFDIDKVNTELAKFGVWHRKHPRAKATPWHQI